MMSTPTTREQFNAKATKAVPKDFLGTATEQVRFNDEKNRFEQCYTNGIIVSKSPSPKKKDDLILSFGQLFNAAWSQGGAWLGDPLEDVYEARNLEGDEVLVQRFKKGVIWCRKDGAGEVMYLSWRDWHMISRPGNNKDSIP